MNAPSVQSSLLIRLINYDIIKENFTFLDILNVEDIFDLNVSR